MNTTNLERNASQQRANIGNKNREALATFGYRNSNNQIEMLNGHLLHQQDFTGSGKIIAVMDTGFVEVDATSLFQRLQDYNLILGGYDFVNNSTVFYTGDSHGTMVLSTMGGYVENELVGTAIMAGLVACLWQALPNKTNAEILQLVKESASLYATPNAQFGYGISDFNWIIQNALGTDSFAAKKCIVYPNPVENVLNVAFPKASQNDTITIYNNLGQLVLEKGIHNSTYLSLEHLTAGIYFYKVASGHLLQKGKLINR